MTVTVIWDDGAWEDVMRSEEVNDAVYKAAKAVASAAAKTRDGYGHSKGSPRTSYGAKSKRLSSSCVGIVHPASRDARNLAAAHPEILLEAAERTNLSI